ncbi:hypothetical protein QG37_02217 [Candidozyma auris]|uniref:Uncharacterized protein n=1 Tax=Candidozyma auris TaxID=498019 RepID=A0A0L0P2S1_CANAR|nr:hypothetical protein QG37_02217 [[Candida] auris]
MRVQLELTVDDSKRLISTPKKTHGAIIKDNDIYIAINYEVEALKSF